MPSRVFWQIVDVWLTDCVIMAAASNEHLRVPDGLCYIGCSQQGEERGAAGVRVHCPVAAAAIATAAAQPSAQLHSHRRSNGGGPWVSAEHLAPERSVLDLEGCLCPGRMQGDVDAALYAPCGKLSIGLLAALRDSARQLENSRSHQALQHGCLGKMRTAWQNTLAWVLLHLQTDRKGR